MRHLFFILLLIPLSACKTNAQSKTINEAITPEVERNKPNVIIILVDDAGYVDFGFMGSKDLSTPEIDKLATSGVVFTDAHVSATVCAPSRAGLITGQYQQRFGFEANGTGDEKSGDVGLSDDVVTMADVFKDNGYKTFALGKWHLGSAPSDHPNQRGFDEFYGFLAGSRSYFPLLNPSKAAMLQHNGERVEFTGYMTDVLGDQSVEFVAENPSQPFFMYLAYNAVHTPMEAKKEDLEKFKDHPRQKLAAMIWSLDQNVGKLLNKLDELDIREHTLVYFLSDNGGAHNNDSKTGPLKGWKSNEFEGGHRVPFVVSWPQQLKGNRKFDGLTSSLDIFATSLAAAGIRKPENLPLGGVNLLPYLKGNQKGDPHKKLFWRKLEESAVRVGDFKVVSLEGYSATMYNLKNDLGETKDLSTVEKGVFSEVMRAYKNWEAPLMQPLWVEGKDWMNVSYHIHQSLMQNKEPQYKDPWAEDYKKQH